jgi:thymidylate synthase ThyX
VGFSARILADSRSPAGVRLTSMEVRYPRFIHSELMTHRVFSRNSASSRAIPIKKMIATVREEPAMPVWWGRNQSGMSAREEVAPDVAERAKAEWLAALDDALRHAEQLAAPDIDLHKQLVNRLLEPFAWITVIVTATEWANFFTQRTHPDAQPEIQKLAQLMLAAYRASTPATVALGRWHVPLIQDDERELPDEVLCRLSVARCARVSYLTHDGRRDREKDLDLYDKLLEGGANGHWSPFEHVATPSADPAVRSGNFIGWEQFRKRFPQEHADRFPEDYAATG